MRKLTVRYLNPQVERMPAKEPMMMAPTGVIIMSAQAPTATPPASVAFWAGRGETKLVCKVYRTQSLCRRRRTNDDILTHQYRIY